MASVGPKPIYHSTHQVAQLLGVSLHTVINWVNGGLLTAHRTPGGHRRIAQQDLITFAREQHYPLQLATPEAETKKRTVLIVDDEPDFAEVIREYLALKGGLDVHVADDPFLAGLAIGALKPDVVVIALQLAGLDGFGLIQRLRNEANLPGLPLIACNDLGDSEIERAARAAGFADVLTKPLKLDVLLACVQRALSG